MYGQVQELLFSRKLFKGKNVIENLCTTDLWSSLMLYVSSILTASKEKNIEKNNSTSFVFPALQIQSGFR